MAAERNAFAVVVFSIFGVDIVVVAAETAVAFADSADSAELEVVVAAAAVWHNATAAIVGFVADIDHIAFAVTFSGVQNPQSDTSGRLHGIPRPFLADRHSEQLFRAFQPFDALVQS